MTFSRQLLLWQCHFTKKDLTILALGWLCLERKGAGEGRDVA